MKHRSRWTAWLITCVAAFAATGCATSFEGDAHVPNGAAGCRDACEGLGMDLAGMVVMGEYSDGCICKARGTAGSTDDTALAVAGAAPATVGVMMAMRARQHQSNQTTMH